MLNSNIKSFNLALGLAVCALPLQFVAAQDSSATSLAVGFGPTGLTSLVFSGHDYLQRAVPDIRIVRLQDSPDSTVGGSTTARAQSFDPVSRTLAQTFDWGTVRHRYIVQGDRLLIESTVENTGTQPIERLDMGLAELQFPQLPTIHTWQHGRISNDNVDGPTVLPAPHPEALLVMVNEVVDLPLRSGFDRVSHNLKRATLYFRIGGEASGLERLPDGQKAVVHARGDSRGQDLSGRHSLDRETLHRPIHPGKSETIRLSLRFASPAASPYQVAADVYERYQKAFPPTLVWRDRRPITTTFLSSSASQHKSATNPRGWLNDPQIDVFSQAGRAGYHERMLRFADLSINGAKSMNAQGIIVWDVEGQEMPHPISYIGDPRMIEEMAPEMNEIADAFFQRILDAGLRTGITIRPTTVAKDSQNPGFYRHWYGTDTTGSLFLDRLTEKVAYAKERWGVTLIYIDTNIVFRPNRSGDWSNQLFAPAMLAELRMRFPDVLFIPEFGVTAYHGHAGPYAELRSHSWGGIAETSRHARSTYPKGFTVVNVADGPIDARWNDLVRGVRNGDILMTRSWWSGNDEHNKVRQIYEEAGVWNDSEAQSFSSWSSQHFGDDSHAEAISGPTANPTGDGVANLLKFYLGQDPLQPQPSFAPSVQLSPSGENLILRFWRCRDAIGVSGRIEWSTTLQPTDWHVHGTQMSVVALESAHELVEAVINAKPSPHLFFRLVVKPDSQ